MDQPLDGGHVRESKKHRGIFLILINYKHSCKIDKNQHQQISMSTWSNLNTFGTRMTHQLRALTYV